MDSELKARIANKGIRFLLCSFVELAGTPKAKLVPVTHIEDTARDGAGFAGFAAGDLNQGPQDADICSVPDFRGMTALPWKQEVAWVPGNLHVDGKPWSFCPRTTLCRHVEALRQRGWTLNAGVEPEFMLLTKENGQFRPWDTLDTLGKPCYDLRALHRNLDLMTTLVGAMQDLGWQPYATDHEDANCQFEINWTYSDALTTADRHVFFKWMVKTLAEQRGLFATFMPKPFQHLTGNGSHFHLSLASAESGENVFLDTNDPLGLSQTARWFLGGVLHHARGLAAIVAPTVNSYKRLVRRATRSGATWAPVYVTYGASNRTQMIRIPGPGRIEVRVVDGAANPYLAPAALLAAGLDGIDKRMDPGAPNNTNLYEASEDYLASRKIGFLPGTLEEALNAFAEDRVLREALGEEYAAYYVAVKRQEWREYHQSVSAWETDRYLLHC
ncbi:MAG TPA: type III glutamate--ammonia ligase [Bryobacteraceae bacterium]|nr:type III glutamate--ammonia ligase [Bryobacteraceae bacterium]